MLIGERKGENVKMSILDFLLLFFLWRRKTTKPWKFGKHDRQIWQHKVPWTVLTFVSQLIIVQLTSLGLSFASNFNHFQCFALTGTMSENSYDQVLQLSLLGCQRSNETCGFRRHQAGYSSLSREVPSSLFHSPYVAIEYQLGVEQHPNQEIWSCVMSATKDGFCVVSKPIVNKLVQYWLMSSVQ